MRLILLLVATALLLASGLGGWTWDPSSMFL
jgi:hypothetical protein